MSRRSNVSRRKLKESEGGVIEGEVFSIELTRVLWKFLYLTGVYIERCLFSI